jgi:hypothetical protein
VALSAGTRVGPYEISALIAVGGMGEVYRAKDTKLARDVALKVLPDAFVADPERLAGYRREAQILAPLNHPNIAQVYGLEEGPVGAVSDTAAPRGRRTLRPRARDGAAVAARRGDVARRGAVGVASGPGFVDRGQYALNAWAAAIGQPAFVTSTFAELTGAPPRTFLEWATDHAAEFRA